MKEICSSVTFLTRRRKEIPLFREECASFEPFPATPERLQRDLFTALKVMHAKHLDLRKIKHTGM